MDAANFLDTFGHARIIESPAIDTYHDIFLTEGYCECLHDDFQVREANI